MATKIATRLKRHLKKEQGNLGRAGAEIERLSAFTGLSVHQLQSIAMGRRGVSEASTKVLDYYLPAEKTSKK